MKRAIAVLLTLTMWLSLPLAAFAEEITPLDETVSFDAMDGDDEAILKQSTSYPAEGGNLYFDPDTGMITGAQKTVTNAVIPSSINGVAVTGIKQWAFYENPVLKSVTIPDTVRNIEKGAFYGCTALETLTIPEGVTEASEMLCYHCTSLRRVYFPNSLQRISRLAFYECYALEYVTIPSNVATVCEMAFYDCTSLKGVDFKNGSTVLERTRQNDGREMNLVFWHCYNIETVVNCPDADWSQRILQNRWVYDHLSKQNATDYIQDEGADAVTYREIAEQVTAGLRTDYEKCRAIILWVIRHVDYDPEFARTKQDRPDIHRDSKTLIAAIRADESKQVYTTCGGYTDVTLSLLWSIGIPATGIHREQKAGERIDHEWGIAYLDNRWVWFDTTHCDPDDPESNEESERTASSRVTQPSVFDAKSCGLAFNFDHRADRIQQPNGRFEDIPDNISMPEMVNTWDNGGNGNGGQNADDAAIRAFVTRMYRVALGRDPDGKGLNSWVNDLKSGTKKGADIAQGFYMSPEIFSTNPTSEEYVELAYLGMMNRPSDAGGKANWVEALNSGVTCNAIIRGFVGSQEFHNLCANYGIQPGEVTVEEPRDQNVGVTKFVARLYTQALGRPYDVGGLNDWTAQILANPSKENILNISTNGFLNSQEFLNKGLPNEEFVRVLYRTFLGREADPDGLNDWLNRMNNGASRDEIAAGFANSPEFAGIMAQYGL